MRYLAIDLGDKRTGLAVGDSVTRIATPVGVVEVAVTERDGEALVSALVTACEEYLGPAQARGELVVGLPVNMDGTEGPRAKSVRALGERVAQRTGRKVHFQDERLTSSSADWTMARSGLTHKQKKSKRDALAAAAFLGDFLAASPSGPGGGTDGGERH